MAALVKVCGTDTSAGADVELLATDVSISSVFGNGDRNTYTITTKTVEPDWFDTHKILAYIKNLKYNGYGGSGQKLFQGSWQWEVNSEGHPELTYMASYDRWYNSSGADPQQTGALLICDFYAVKMPKEG